MRIAGRYETPQLCDLSSLNPGEFIHQGVKEGKEASDTE